MQIRFERCLAGGHEVEETLLVRSYDLEPLALELDLRLATDFAPMLALRGIVDAGDGDRAAVERFEHGVRFTARGRDGRHRATTITADRAVAVATESEPPLLARASAGRPGDDRAALQAL